MLHVYVGFSLAHKARTKYVYCSESSWDRMKKQENKNSKEATGIPNEFRSNGVET